MGGPIAEPTNAAALQRAIDRRAANWIARVLRAGVLLSATLLAIGVVRYLLSADRQPATLDAALGRDGPVARLAIGSILRRLADGDAIAFIECGILVLILTPIVRVGLTIVQFAIQRDWRFVGLASIVIVILLLGLLGIGA